MNKDCGKLASLLIILFFPYWMHCNPRHPTSLQFVIKVVIFFRMAFLFPQAAIDLRLSESLRQDYVTRVLSSSANLRFQMMFIKRAVEGM